MNKINSQNPQNPENSVQKKQDNRTRIKICIIKNCKYSNGTTLPIRMFR